MKVLVCGGRDFSDSDVVFEALGAIHAENAIQLVIHGGASGADSLADAWAVENTIPRSVFKADWPKFGRSAGPIRNVEMLTLTQPDLVVAFSGGKGTANMVALARRHKFAVREV